jgi:hypothetical protein
MERCAPSPSCAQADQLRPLTDEGDYSYAMRQICGDRFVLVGDAARLKLLFTAFVIDERYRLDVLKLLQGDVYDEDEPAVLSRMRAIVAEVESNPSHLWHPFLGDLRADDLALTL